MSYTKAYENKPIWINNREPAINEQRLNALSGAVDVIDNRVIDLDDKRIENIAGVNTVNRQDGQVLAYNETTNTWENRYITGPEGSPSYTPLLDKPQINGHVLSGNTLSSDLGLANASDITAINNDLSQFIDDGYVESVNLFNKETVKKSTRLNGTGQEEADVSGTFSVTDYIKIYKGKTVYIPATGSARQCTYDTNKSFLEYLNNGTARAYTPTQDGYIRLTLSSNTISADDLMINYGTSPLPYRGYAKSNVELTNDLSHLKYGGKNLYNETLEIGGILYNNGQNTNATGRVRTKGYIKVAPNTTYTFKCFVDFDLSNISVYGYKADKQPLSTTDDRIGYITTPTKQISFTTPSNCEYARLNLIGTEITDIKCQLELGNTATDYEEPYDGVIELTNDLITLDYTKKVPIANQNMPSGSFTAPRNGIALCNLQINVTGYVNVVVNGVFVATTSTVGGQVTPVLMKKGDVMTWNSNNDQNYMRCDGATRSIFI